MRHQKRPSFISEWNYTISLTKYRKISILNNHNKNIQAKRLILDLNTPEAQLLKLEVD